MRIVLMNNMCKEGYLYAELDQRCSDKEIR